MAADRPCTLDDDPLARTLGIIREAPHSAPALTLYALVSTLELEQAGCLFKLTKLRDLDPETRVLAYGLIELMVCGEHRESRWQSAKQAMDEVVRHG